MEKNTSFNEIELSIESVWRKIELRKVLFVDEAMSLKKGENRTQKELNCNVVDKTVDASLLILNRLCYYFSLKFVSQVHK